jgi:DNA-binding transcriptional ArsR family regulator
VQDQGKQPNHAEPAVRQALAHPKRLAIFEYLAQKGRADEAELVEALDLAALTVKYHLSVLYDADLIARVEDEGHGQAGRSYIAAPPAGL